MPSFFTTPGSAKKRKRTESTGGPAGGARKKSGAATAPSATKDGKKKKQVEDEDISSEEEDDRRRGGASDSSEDEDEEFANETAADRRRRLALQYLDNTRTEIEEIGFDAKDVDRDLLAQRLRESVAEDKGLIYRHLSDTLSFADATSTLFRADTKTVTGVASCYPYIYTVTKDRHITKWALPPSDSTALKPKQVLHTRCSTKKTNPTYEGGHTDEILCVAASQDGKFVATGGKDNKIVVWDPNTLKPLRIFRQHRSPVMGLVFRRGTNQLYSCSADRTVKLWSLDELAYIETLFGHQDEVVGITALAGERCVTVGARDRTARLWKIVDETQLVFRGEGDGGSQKKRKSLYPEGSLDCVAMIDEDHFVTGSHNGTLSLWSLHKKKAVFLVATAHGIEPPLPAGQYSAESNPENIPPPPPPQPRQITALAAIPYSDTFFSGSYDGHIRVWCISKDKKKFESAGILGQHPSTTTSEEGGDGTTTTTATSEPPQAAARGVVNAITVFEAPESADGKKKRIAPGETEVYVAAALGKEMRLGRWMTVREGKNAGCLFRIPRAAPKEVAAAAEKEKEKEASPDATSP
ncbi:WD40-repeat-containing domain protein [Peziza echinospora]|nr:WD40-repeat-containing domain protein [Peziza echinospora]